MNLLIFVLLVILLTGGAGTWGGPVYAGGTLGTLLIILLVLWFLGVLR